MGVGVEDVEAQLALHLRVRSVVDDDLQFGAVTLPKEARDVGPDHEILDAFGLLVEGSAAQILREGVDPDVPGGHRIGNLKLDGGGAVGAGDELGLPKGRLCEIRPDLHRGGLGFGNGLGLRHGVCVGFFLF